MLTPARLERKGVQKCGREVGGGGKNVISPWERKYDKRLKIKERKRVGIWGGERRLTKHITMQVKGKWDRRERKNRYRLEIGRRNVAEGTREYLVGRLVAMLSGGKESYRGGKGSESLS